jgi:hypothetical protein
VPALQQAFAQDPHEARWQKSVGDRACIRAGKRPEIRPGPDKIIRLAEDDPRTLAIKAETLFRWNWNFQRVSRISGRAMSYRKHANDRMLLAFTEKNHDDGAGPILDAFFATLTGFRFPEVMSSE